MCQRTTAHVQLRGADAVFHKPWNAEAELYPRGFSRMIGCVGASDIGWKKERLDIAGCARAASLRIGEAGNPGPRARAVPRRFSLEEAPVNYQP